mgnify:CR=1 FL=1
MTKDNIPKWFNGTIYKEGDVVTNPFSGETYKLTGLELSIYDFIMGSQMMFEMGMIDEQKVRDFEKGLDWFRKNNPKAYMVLLD